LLADARDLLSLAVNVCGVVLIGSDDAAVFDEKGHGHLLM
jgi:hypothetical protein